MQGYIPVQYPPLVNQWQLKLTALVKDCEKLPYLQAYLESNSQNRNNNLMDRNFVYMNNMCSTASQKDALQVGCVCGKICFGNYLQEWDLQMIFPRMSAQANLRMQCTTTWLSQKFESPSSVMRIENGNEQEQKPF